MSLTFEVHRKAMTAPVLSFFLAVVSCHAVLLCLFLFQRSVTHSLCHWWSWVFPPSIYRFKPRVCSIPVWTSSGLLQYLLLWSKLCWPLCPFYEVNASLKWTRTKANPFLSMEFCGFCKTAGSCNHICDFMLIIWPCSWREFGVIRWDGHSL